MCSNFEVTISDQRWLSQYHQTIPPIQNSNLRPTDEVTVIKTNFVAETLRWGFRTDWSPSPLINARTETLTQKKTFQQVHNNRCLVPASAWFEWRQTDKEKLKNRISLTDVKDFAIGAIYDEEACCLLTAAACKQLNNIHHRMPVIVPSQHFDQWLNPSQTTADISPIFEARLTLSFTFEEEASKIKQLSLF